MSLPPREPPQTEEQPTQTPPKLPNARRTRPWVVRFPATFGLIAFTMLVFLVQWFSLQILDIDLVPDFYKHRQAIAAGEVKTPEVVEMQAEGTRPPFFVVAPFPIYRLLAQGLGPDQPFLGLPLPEELPEGSKIEHIARVLVRGLSPS